MRTALVTGASGGIGLELASVFARNRWDLLLVSRNSEKLERASQELARAHGVTARTLAMDLAKPGAPEKLFREAASRSWRVDALVNNAGLGSFGPFSGTDPARDEEILSLNIVCLTKLTKLFLAPMLERREGFILNVASTAAFQPGPMMAVYYASKAYVLSFSEALANELESSGVSVTALCPGATRTGFQERANMTGSRLFKGRVMDARTVAEAGYRGLMAQKRIVVPGFKNKALAASVRFAPRGLVTRIVRKIQEVEKSQR